MDGRRWSIAAWIVAVMCCAGVLPAAANVTTGSWLLDQSSEFADGPSYGQVDISADDSTGQVEFTVTSFVSPYDSILGNYGIQRFGFNYNPGTVLSAPGLVDFALPTGWSVGTNQVISGFGEFAFDLSGTGGTRQDPLEFTLTLPDAAEAVASSFAFPSTGVADQGNAFFVAHVADVSVAGSNATSHYIGGDEEIPSVPVPGAALLVAMGVGALSRFRRHAA